MSQSVDFRLRVERLSNGSLVAMLTGPSNVSAAALVPGPAVGGRSETASSLTSRTNSHRSESASSIGALYYVIAVILIYGFSIILMIGSQIRKNKHDKGVSRYMKDIEKVRRLERHQEKFKMRLAMQHKHPVLGHTRSARALERSKLDRSINKDKGGRHFVGCYSHVEDEESMTMRETEATANSCVPTETTTAAETSLMNETCRPDRQHAPTSSNTGDDYDDADQADQYSDVFVDDGAKDLEDHSATDTRQLQLSLASVTSEEDDQERHRTAEMWEDGNVEDSTSCGLSPDNDIDDYDVDDAVFDSNSTIVDDQAPMNALLEHTSHVG